MARLAVFAFSLMVRLHTVQITQQHGDYRPNVETMHTGTRFEPIKRRMTGGKVMHQNRETV